MHNLHVLAWVASWRPWKKCQFCKYHGEFIASSGWLIFNVMCWVLPFPEGSYFFGHLPTLKKNTLHIISASASLQCMGWHSLETGRKTYWLRSQEERHIFLFWLNISFSGTKTSITTKLCVVSSTLILSPCPFQGVRLLITEGDRGY